MSKDEQSSVPSPESNRHEREKAVLKDSLEYGLEYGLEDGLEAGIAEGIKKGLTEGGTSTVINTAEEALGDVLGNDLDTPAGKASSPGENSTSNESGPDGQSELTPEQIRSKQVRKRIFFWVKLAIVILVLGWIAMRLVEAWGEISQYDWQLRYPWILLSGVLYLVAFLPAATLWYLSLHWMGQEPTYFRAVWSFYASQLGKYLPGKAMVVVIRSGMVAGEKVKTSIAAVCVFYETLTMMATGAFLSALIILIYFREHWLYSLMALGTMLAAGLPVLPPIFIRVVHFLRIGKNDPSIHGYLSRITWRSVAVGFGLMTILWIFFGAGLWAAIQGLGVVPGNFLENMPRYVSVTALAIVLGFAVPVSPGGIGIREAVLSILLIPYFETILNMPENGSIHVGAETLALIVSLEQRMISIVAELALVGMFLLVIMWGIIRK